MTTQDMGDIPASAVIPGHRYTVFITMHSDPATSFFDWERSLEELRGIIADHTYSGDWGATRVYGPDAQGFSTPSIAVRVALTGPKLRSMLRELEAPALKVWLPRVEILIATSLTGGEDVFEMLETLEAVAP